MEFQEVYSCKINNSINSLSPYVGKIRLELADFLIEKYADKQGLIYDPFMGSGSVLLQGWSRGYSVIGSDLNYYAYVLSKGKLEHYPTFEEANKKLTEYREYIEKRINDVSLEEIPDWVKQFFNEQTLKEICLWTQCLKRNEEWFLLSNLLGILHHQRPGFLSYPASNGAPYLRDKKYPIDEYPEMYAYKNVYEKLQNKVKRSYQNIPNYNYSIKRYALFGDSTRVQLNNYNISTIITSPPYMKSLTYARDNRLRLWFLGEEDWKELDKKISPEKVDFYILMEKCFKKWARIQEKGGKCIVIIGDILVNYNKERLSLSDVMVKMASKYYCLIESFNDPIPESKKMVKGNNGIKKEIILVFERNEKHVR